jgi:O-glycosyl hydrolase
MKTTKKLLGIFGAALIFSLVFMGCPTDSTKEEEEIPALAVSATILISEQPASIDYVTGDTIAPLTVTATATNSGTLTYQWYSNTSYANTDGTAISGQTTTSYTPPNQAEAFYYVVVINTDDTATASSPARIRVLASAPAAPAASLTVSATERQYVRGIGGMSNVWSSPDMKVRDIETMFNPITGLGLNILRICLYPYMDDIINNIEIPDRDNSDWYNIVKTVNKHNGYVLASPWTPPAEWKDPQSRNGGSHLLPSYYPQYATHLKEFAQRMYDNGAPIYALSIQNEPNFVASYDGCEWTAEQQRAFFAGQGHFTDGVKGWGGGVETPSVKTMTGEVANTVSWNNAAMNDATASAAIDLVGYHIYGGLESRYANALENTTKPKETWMTEHNINTTGNFPIDSTWEKVWLLVDEIHTVLGVNDSSAFIWWYSKRFYSLIGDGEYGTVEGQPLWRGWAMSHYAKYAAGTTRVDLSASGISGYADNGTVRGTAYKSTDGNSYSLVFYNKGDSAVGDIQINLPDGFEASSVSAIITDGTKKQEAHLVTLSRDKKSGVITLPASAIISVKFVK